MGIAKATNERECKGTAKECPPRNVKRRGGGCQFQSDSLYEQINENPPNLEIGKKGRGRAEERNDSSSLLHSLSSDNDLRQPDSRFLHFFRLHAGSASDNLAARPVTDEKEA